MILYLCLLHVNSVTGNHLNTRPSMSLKECPVCHILARLVPGSPAERSHQLRVGDRLLTVNGVSITGLRHDDIVRIIRDSGPQVDLTILPQARKLAVLY